MTSRIEDILRDVKNKIMSEFAIPEKYTPKDRTMEQLSQIWNNDVAGEAISDYKENQREMNTEAYLDFYKGIEKSIDDALSHALSEIKGLLPEKRELKGGAMQMLWQKGFNSAIDEVIKLFGKGE